MKLTENSIIRISLPWCMTIYKTIRTGNPRESSCNLEGIVTGAVPMETDREALREAERFVARRENSPVDAWPSLFVYTPTIFIDLRVRDAPAGECVPFISYVSTPHSRVRRGESSWIARLRVLGCFLPCQLGGVGPGRNERAPPYDTSVFGRKIIRKRRRTSPVFCRNSNYFSSSGAAAFSSIR